MAEHTEIKPSRYWLYRLYNERRILLYIGITRNLDTRLHEHRRDQSWWPDVAVVTQQLCRNREAAADLELAKIIEERPLRNIALNIRGRRPRKGRAQRVRGQRIAGWRWRPEFDTERRTVRGRLQQHAVYRAFSEGEQLLYVGATLNYRKRVAEHERKTPWWPAVHRIVVEWHPNRMRALRAEQCAIQTEHPLHNVHFNGHCTVQDGQTIDRSSSHPTHVDRRRAKSIERRREAFLRNLRALSPEPDVPTDVVPENGQLIAGLLVQVQLGEHEQNVRAGHRYCRGSTNKP